MKTDGPRQADMEQKSHPMNPKHTMYAKRVLVAAMIGSGGLLACISLAISLHLMPQLG